MEIPNNHTSLRALFNFREQELKKELSTFEREFLRHINVDALAEKMGKKYAVAEIQATGKCEVSTNEKFGFCEHGRNSDDHTFIAITVRAPVVHDKQIPQIIELTKARVHSPAKIIRYSEGFITMEAAVPKDEVKVIVQHLEADIEKRNRVIREENINFQRRAAAVIMEAWTHYFTRTVTLDTYATAPKATSASSLPVTRINGIPLPSNPQKQRHFRKPIGIDLGTTYCAIAHIDTYGRPQIISNIEKERITPSVILFEGQNVTVGTIAKQSAVAEPDKVVDFVKREMGKSKEEFSREFDGKIYSAEELSALILRKLKKDAEAYLGEQVTDAVITVPAYFNDAERTATLHAGQLAGMNILQIINEPTAAALSYGLDKLNKDQTVFVFDLGGGTFDVTIMRIEDGHIKMLASNGDHRLGGKDWDDVIVRIVADEFERQHGENPLLDLHNYQDLYSRALSAKIQLSSRTRTTIVHSFNGKSVKIDLSREEYEERCRPLLERCKATCEIVIQEAAMQWTQIDRVLLTGGMSRMPSVREMVCSLTRREVAPNVSPDEAVAVGAAIQAMLSMLYSEDEIGQREIPQQVRSAFSSENGSLIKVTNITTHSLGVVLWDQEKNEEYVHPMIPKMTAIPSGIRNSFTSLNAGFKNGVVRVVEGESTVPTECTPLGSCEMDFPEIPHDAPVEITYHYNENQVLEVTVEADGHTSHATISRNTGVATHEIELATKELEKLELS